MTESAEKGARRRGAFPTTAVSQVLAIRSTDPIERGRSFEILMNAYYKPVYKYTRIRWKKSEDEAKDITQDFFAASIEKGTFARYEPDKARFRTYIRMCLDRFISKQHRAGRAQKRGGGAPLLSLDFDGIERELAQSPEPRNVNAEEYFDHEWIRHLLGSSVDSLRRQYLDKNKPTHFAVFERLDLSPDGGERPSYAEVAADLGMSVTDVTNRLAHARREFRRIVLDKLRELTATDEEFRSEAFAVLGIRV